MAKLSSNRTGGNGVQVETEIKKIIVMCHVRHKTLNLVISRSCLAEQGGEMYQNLASGNHMQITGMRSIPYVVQI